MASILTEQDVDDPSQVGPLLDQIEHQIGQVTADGAYDGEPTYETIARRDPQIQVVIPPRVTAQPSAQFETHPTTRDTHLLMIQNLGRLGWQEAAVAVAVLNRMLGAGRPKSFRTSVVAA